MKKFLALALVFVLALGLLAGCGEAKQEPEGGDVVRGELIISIEVNYPNDYDDPAKGKECALALNDKGADVIFQIASKAGDGVFEAAQERSFWAIGVDCDQKYIADDVIICSMKKEVGNSIYEAVKQYMAGDTSLWGTTWNADLATGYVGIGYGEEGSTQQVSDEIKAEVESLAEKIVSGEIVVDTVR